VRDYFQDELKFLGVTSSLAFVREQVRQFQATRQPVISVDTKKKELVGDFKTPGARGAREGSPSPCGCTTFSSPPRARPCHMACTMLTRTAGG
jgi:hypothetical protein